MHQGLFLIIISSLIPAYWFFNITETRDDIALFSQYMGCVSIIFMSYTQLMATRFKGHYLIFGATDKMYQLHKWIAIASIVFLMIHDTIDAEIKRVESQSLISEIGETLGEISLYGLLILAIISIATFIPYHLWKYTHKFMGAFFIFSAAHFILIDKPFTNSDPLGLYMIFFSLMGGLCYFYTLIPFGIFQGYKTYKVDKIEKNINFTIISLKPKRKNINYKAGQFAFFQFQKHNLNEIHPFTISNAPHDDGSLRLSIGALGDYTAKIPSQIQQNDEVKISGGFGHFTRAKHNIWIAGGIGITPFLAWAEDLKPHDKPAHLFYSVHNIQNAAHIEDLKHFAQKKENFHLHIIETQKNGRLSAEKIMDMVEMDMKDMHIAFCGSKAMRDNLRDQFMALGLKSSRFEYEIFEMRSGIGFRKFMAWAIDLLSKKSHKTL